MEKKDLKELLHILIETNIKVAELMNRDEVNDRALIYLIKTEVSSEFDKLLEAIGAVDNKATRDAYINTIKESMKVEELDSKVDELFKEIDVIKEDVSSNNLFNGLKDGKIAEA